MFLRLSRFCLLLVAVLSALLGNGALTEQVVELAAHGHPAHSVPGEADGFCGEAGEAPCEGPRCDCHTTTSASQGLVETVAVHESAWVFSLSDEKEPAFAPGRSRRPFVSDETPHTRALAPPTPPPNLTV